MAEVPLPTPTQVPVPSTDIRNAVFAGAKLDEEVTGTGEYYTDRLGVRHLTNTGRNNQFNVAQQERESRFDAFIQSSGYEVIGDYYDGPLNITEYNQLVRYKGELYKLTAATDLPHTTAGNTDASWAATDSVYFVSVGDASLRQNLGSNSGGELIGLSQGTTVQDEINGVQFLKQIPGFYYGSFFNNGSRNINIAVSKNGIDFSDTVIVRLPDGQTTYNSDPSIVFFKGRWYVAYTTTQAGVFDFGIGYSDDLFTWKNKFAQLNNGTAVCSNTKPWDDGTRPASMIWAPEFTVINNELYVIVSIYLGYDTTSGASSTLNRFGTGIARLIDPESFTFGELARINYSDNNEDNNYYSRIDAIIKYDQRNNQYWQVVKRENYGILDTFVSNELHGKYQYLGTIDALQNVPGASTGYLNTSGIEAPTVYQLPDGETWSIAFDMYNTSDGIGYVTTKDFVTFSTPAKLTLDRLRHGTIQSSSETPLTPEAEHQLTSYIRSSSAVIHYNRPLSSQDTPNGMSIIPQSDTIYHAAVGGRTINLVRPVGKNYPKNFYFSLDLDGAQHKLTIAGDVFNSPIVIGNGITNNKLVRFEWDGFNGKYRCVDNLKINSANLSFPSSTITTSFYPEYGRTYLTLTSITINGLSGNLPDGYWFNIILSSNQHTRMIKFAAGTDSNFLGTPAIWNYTGEKFDSVPITVRKCGDRWYVSHPPATVG